MWANPRDPPLPRASPNVLLIERDRSCSSSGGAGKLPCLVRERPHKRSHRQCLLAGRRAVAGTPDDALEDRSEAKEIIGEVDRKIRARIESGARHIGVDICAARGDAQRVEVMPYERAHASTR